APEQMRGYPLARKPAHPPVAGLPSLPPRRVPHLSPHTPRPPASAHDAPSRSTHLAPGDSPATDTRAGGTPPPAPSARPECRRGRIRTKRRNSGWVLWSCFTTMVGNTSTPSSPKTSGFLVSFSD